MNSTPTVSDDDLRDLVSQGLLALKAGGRIAARATDDIHDSATTPDLKKTLEQGNETAKEWRARVDRAMDEFGVEGEGDNPIIEAHVEVAERIRNEADTDGVRDLGIIASASSRSTTGSPPSVRWAPTPSSSARRTWPGP